MYIIFFLFHLIGGSGLDYPAVDPNELSVIAVADFFAGRNWAGVMVAVDYYYGFLQGLIYTPAVLIFDDPSVQYKVMLAVNSALISVIPLIAYYLAYRMRTGKIWKCMITAFAAGGYCCYYAHTKFAWTETVSIVLPWIIIWLVFRTADCKNKTSRFFMSFLTGAVCGISFAAHTRLIAVVLALTAAVILERVFFGKKIINLAAYFSSLAIVTCGVVFVSYILQRYLWCAEDPSLLKNTLTDFFTAFSDNISGDGFMRITNTLCAQMYYYTVTTWGLGAVSFCLFAAVLSSCIKHKAKKEQQSYEPELSVFSFFSVLTVVFTICFSTLYRFSSDGYGVYQDTMMFGRFIDGVVPFALVFVLIMLFTHSISVNKILGAGAVLGVVYIAFILTSVPVILNSTSTRIAPVLGLYPLRVGAASRELLNFDSLMLTMSMTFCVMGVLLVVISCTKRYRSIIISALMTTITVYSLVFISVVYLPICRNESVEKNTSVCELSKHVFNQVGAPSVTAYNISRHDALMLQFLNRNITVKVTYDIESVPENSFLAVNISEDISALENSMTPFLMVAESGDLRLYAYGERASAYMVSQDIGAEELESEKETLIPEKTTSPAESSTVTSEVTAIPYSSVTTTERTPVVTTYTLPSVITLPVDSLDEDDNWAVIE
ncbi:MAG: hypothetical protein J6N15_04700 [Ruminiclostridium sp.]|nr:hypothetical protein [Ruminiclostridium sp.]